MNADFQIVTAGIPATADEWLRAQHAPENQLPEMSEADRTRAKSRWMTDMQYRRHLALRRFAAQRESLEAEALGRRVQLFLPEAGGGNLESLVRRGKAYEWQAYIRQIEEGKVVYKTVAFLSNALMMSDSEFSDALKHALQPGQEVRATG